ncbi:MAG: glycosyl hydrolase [Gemmatimonadetes bacterium]|nr:glycosyl hydrolase [Gemmatimonadota bacterium]
MPGATLIRPPLPAALIAVSLALVTSVTRIETLSAQTTEAQYDTTLYQGMKWRNIGPFRGGRSVAAHGVTSDPLTYYMGSVGGGVWKTTDAGVSWSNITDGADFGTSSVGAIAVAESDLNVVYVGMGEHSARGVMTSHGDGVYRSTDAGKTWSHLGLEKTRAISRIRIHPNDPDLVYVAAQGAPYGANPERGIYRSRDGGTTWEQVLYIDENSGASDLSMDVTNPRILYAAFWDHRRYPWEVRSGGPGSGIHKSTDGGDTWTKLDGFPDLMGKTAVDVSPANPDRVWALIEADPGGGLFRSDDAGATWTVVNDEWTPRARAWYYIEVFADPQDEETVYILNAPMLRSTDGGKTFTRVRTPHGDNHGLWINPTNNKIMINANDGGANVSFNGGKTWSTQRNQPTAQFYRVITDNRFPYWVYGGQQDNSTVAIISRNTAGGGIGWKDWHSVGGCESAHVGFDENNPTLVYAGCYMGQISEWDARTKSSHNIMAYPQLPAAMASRDMKYRFNWNAPIVVSKHDSNVAYHAGNILLRTRDRGITWEEISPDLTRDSDTTQGPGGGPITNEGAGGEIYNTIYYVAESPHDPNTIWAGSDDGLVHVTQDGGESWQDVTPDGLGETTINAIEVSPHDPAAAYIAVTAYKFNDFTPHIYKTNDYGRSWDHVVNGIGEDAFVRVVREDPARRGLLYAGTETGVYVSFDDGERWQSLQLNLPNSPITDLTIRHNDLIAATAGRAFWILDDLLPLQQLNDEVASSDMHLFAPRNAYRVGGGGGFGGGGGAVGQNPPAGAIIDFYLAEEPDSTVTLDILDNTGTVVRSYSTQPDKDEQQDSLPVAAGMNRFAWNLRHSNVKSISGVYVWGTLQGRKAVPGRYSARLSVGGRGLTESFEVLKDPRVDATLADFRGQDAMLVSIRDELTSIHEGVIRLRDVREQVDDVVQRAADHEAADTITAAGQAITGQLDAVEDTLIQKRTVDGQTVINWPSRLNFHYIRLRMAVDGSEGVVTRGARDLFADLSAQWRVHQATLNAILGPQLEAFNELIRSRGIPAIMIPGRRELVP